MIEARLLNSRLLSAIQLNQPESVAELLKAGANPHGLTALGTCPFTVCVCLLADCMPSAVMDLYPEAWSKRLTIASLLGVGSNATT